MKQNFLFFLILLLCCSCKDQSASVCPVINFENITQPTEKSVYDIADAVEIVQLEINDSLLIPYVNKLIMTDEYFILGYGKKCSLFSRAGKFIRDIAQQGNGPEDYGTIHGMLYKDQRIVITDSNNKTKVYSLEGKMLESYQGFSGMFAAVYPVTINDFIGFTAQYRGDEEPSLTFYHRDEKQAMIPHQQKFQAQQVCFFPNEGQFATSNDQLYFKRLLNDTIFSVDATKHSLAPAYTINWGKMASKEELRYTLANPKDELFMHMPYIPLFAMNDDKVILAAITGDMAKQKMYYLTGVYDKESQQSELMELKLTQKEMDYFGKPTGTLPPYLEGDAFFPEFVSEDGDYLISVRPQPLYEDRNPALIVLKLK